MNNRDKVVIGLSILVVLGVLSFFNNSGYKTGSYFIAGECYDTDGGNNKFVRGTIQGHVYPSQEQFKETDYCLYDDPYILKEYMCLRDVNSDTEEYTREDRAKWKSELIVCDYGCKNGACLR